MIEITQWKAIDKGSVVGTFSIRLPKWANFEIRGLTLFAKNGGHWISFPSRQYEKDGKKMYYAYNGFKDQNVQKQFCDEVVKVVLKYLVDNNKSISQQELNLMESNQDDLPF